MFLNAVYEADTLISAMEDRAKRYENLREQLIVLKKTFYQVSHSGDEFQGAGAEAIKHFYQEHAAIVDEWLTFIEMQIAFFQGVAADAAESKLSGYTYVDIDFLERDLVNGYRRSKDMVSDQKQELNSILSSISDLVDLQPFDTGTFEAHLDKAKKERKNTIDKVDELTEKFTYEYQQSEAIQNHIKSRLEALNYATRRGGQASPIYFDAKAYHNSSACKMKDNVQHQAKSYLSFKKEQAEKRKIEKLQKELETPNLSLDEYLKIAEDLGEENLTAEQKLAVDQLKEARNRGEASKGIGKGLLEYTVDTAMSLWYLKHCPMEVAYSTTVALMNPVDTLVTTLDALRNSFQKEVINGDCYSRSRWITYATASVATSIFITRGTDKAVKIGMTAGKKELKDLAGKTATGIKEFGNDLRYQPQDYQPVGAGGGGLYVDVDIPVNVINTGKLYDHINTQVESYLFYKGIDKPLLPEEGKVGTYEDLIDAGIRGDNITPHHMPSAKYMKTKAGVHKNDGVSMNMEQPHPGKGGRHRQTKTYGMTCEKLEDYLNLQPRDALARDIIDARNIYIKGGLYTPKIRSGLLEVINLNKTKYPDMFENNRR